MFHWFYVSKGDVFVRCHVCFLGCTLFFLQQMLNRRMSSDSDHILGVKTLKALAVSKRVFVQIDDFSKTCTLLRLMEEILHHLRCIKPCKYWWILHINWCRISSINSINDGIFTCWQLRIWSQHLSHFLNSTKLLAFVQQILRGFVGSLEIKEKHTFLGKRIT